ncbi:MAG: acyl carrier protein [Hyphomicrobiales bacterium]|nr:acyl carrier protein [Hyphomicrobiales bacterium]MCP5370536.1 acyl carrier protein [Hyphomicrobiales bacterium]
MTEQEIYDRLTPLFQDVLDNDDVVPTPELTARDVDEWDSLSHIRLVVAVEQDFGVSFAAAEIARLENVGQFVALIRSKLGA